MNWTTHTCYRITYEDYSSTTFRIEGEIPPALHHILVRDLNTGQRKRLFDLLISNWIDLTEINCAEAWHQ